MTWDIFGTASRDLATMVAGSGYEPDIILAIARGGLLAAGALGYALAVKNLYTMNVEFYTGVDERLAVPMILPPVPSLVDLKDSKVLIVDDVMSAGTAVRESIQLIQKAGATAHAVAIALDRQEMATENGQDVPHSAVQYVRNQLGMQVCTIAKLADLLLYLEIQGGSAGSGGSTGGSGGSTGGAAGSGGADGGGRAPLGIVTALSGTLPPCTRE